MTLYPRGRVSRDRNLFRGLLGRTCLRWTVLAGGLFAFALFSEITSGTITNDEAWFLQVARRVASGDVLYRDVFFGVTPLSAYLATGLVRLLGVEILVVRGLMAASLVATSLVSLRIARQLRLSKAAQVLIVLGILAFVPSWLPGAGSPYTPLAYVFLLACLSSTLTWLEMAEDGPAQQGSGLPWLLLAGGFAGLAFATKQTIGGYALVALWMVILAGSPRTEPRQWGRLRRLLAASFTFGTVVALTLLPVWATGGAGKFVEYGFLNRGEYIGAATITYGDQLRDWVRLLMRPKFLRDVLYAYWSFQLLLPVAAFVALGLAWLRTESGQRGTALTLLAFSSAAFAGVFPRVGLAHTAPMVAPLAIVLVWGAEQLGPQQMPKLFRGGRALIAICLAIGIAAQVARPLRWLALGTHGLSPLPHFQGVLLRQDSTAALLSQSQAMTNIPTDDALFFLTPAASLFYLLTDRSDPTPYDYPLVTAFGREGQRYVVDEIAGGRIQWVCLTPLGVDPLSPSLLEAYVHSHMQASTDAGVCKLFRRSP